MQPADTTSPYPGPRPFTAAESDRFFGRARETADLAALIIAQPLTVLHGPGGAGKTSLIQAGVVPELERAGFEVLPVARVGGLLPPGTDAAHLRNVFTYSVLLHWAGDDDAAVSDALARHTLATWLRDLPASSRPRVIVLDQLEELFIAYPAQWEQREAFLRELAECLPGDRAQGPDERPVRVLLVIRDQALGELERHAALLPDALRVRYALDGLRVPQAIEAIVGPGGNLFSGTDAETLAKNLAQRRVRTPAGKLALVASETIEPMHIQLACEERLLRGRGGPLARSFDPDEALARFYDAALARVGREKQTRRWISERLITPEGARSTALRGKKNAAGLAHKLAEGLEHERVIRAVQRGPNTWYELSHDRLIAPVQHSNRAWAERQARRRRAWRFVLYMLLFAGVVVGLTYVGQIALQRWQDLQDEKQGLETRLASLDDDKEAVRKELERTRGELAAEQRRVQVALLAAEVRTLSGDLQTLQSVVVDMGRYRPSARDVDLEAETLINFLASGQALTGLSAQVQALVARQEALLTDIGATRKTHADPELKATFVALADAAEALSPELERLQKSLTAMITDYTRYSARLNANLDGFEVPPRPGTPAPARVREASRVQWRAGFRSLLSGDVAGATDRFEKALERDTSNPAASDALARLAWLAGKVDDAEKSYTAALSHSGDYGPALAGMAEVYLHRDALADAERCVRKALASQPDYAPAHLVLSEIGRRRTLPGATVSKVSKNNPCSAKRAAPAETPPAAPAE